MNFDGLTTRSMKSRLSRKFVQGWFLWITVQVVNSFSDHGGWVQGAFLTNNVQQSTFIPTPVPHKNKTVVAPTVSPTVHKHGSNQTNTTVPSVAPTLHPRKNDTQAPVPAPTKNTTSAPVPAPTNHTHAPTHAPVHNHTAAPTLHHAKNQTAPSAAPTMANHTNSSVPTAAPHKAPVLVPTLAPHANKTAAPVPPPVKPTVKPSPHPAVSPTAKPSQKRHPKKRISFLRIIGKAIAWLIILLLSLVAFGAIMTHRYRIYYFLRGVWYTILQMNCTQWIMEKIRWRSGGGGGAYQPIDSSLNTIIFDNDMTEGLLMRETDT